LLLAAGELLSFSQVGRFERKRIPLAIDVKNNADGITANFDGARMAFDTPSPKLGSRRVGWGAFWHDKTSSTRELLPKYADSYILAREILVHFIGT
jgi:hypothetical protein